MIILLGTILLGFFPAEIVLDSYDFTDCAIGVYTDYGDDVLEYLSENQRNEFLNILDKALLYGIGSSAYSNYSGSYKQYVIRLQSGDTLDISHIGPYLVVNRKGYLCNYVILDKLSYYADEVYKKYYSIID